MFDGRCARNVTGGKKVAQDFSASYASLTGHADYAASKHHNRLPVTQDHSDWHHQDCPRHRVDLDRDCDVISDYDSSCSVWIITSGILRLQRYGFDGRRQILSLLLPGEVVGHERHWREGMSVVTATPASLCRIDRRDYEALLEKNPALCNAVCRQQYDQLDRLRWLTWSIGALRPDERLCAFLALSTKFMPYQHLPDGTGVLTMLLARTDIADLLATTVESVSRISHRIAETGVIEIKDPSHFRIMDMQKLITMGTLDRVFDSLPFPDRRQPSHRNDLIAMACENSTVAEA
jgi:CRP-like cAMP-binding protein